MFLRMRIEYFRRGKNWVPKNEFILSLGPCSANLPHCPLVFTRSSFLMSSKLIKTSSSSPSPSPSRYPSLYDEGALDELYVLHGQGHSQSKDLDALQVTVNVARKAYNWSVREIRDYQDKVEAFREFKRGYLAEAGDPSPSQEEVEVACRAEFGWTAGVDDAVPEAVQLARQEVVTLAKLTSLKRKNPVHENPPEEVAQPPRKKLRKRRTQDHCDRPDWRCLICGYISKNHHVHRHLRSKTLPLHDIQDVDLHDSYMIEERGAMPDRPEKPVRKRARPRKSIDGVPRVRGSLPHAPPVEDLGKDLVK